MFISNKILLFGFVILSALFVEAQTIVTYDRHDIIGHCRRTDTNPQLCAIKYELKMKLDEKNYEFCWEIKGVYPHNESSLHPLGLISGARLVVVDPGPLSGAIAEFTLTGKWRLYDSNEKKWLYANEFGQDIEANLTKRAKRCTIQKKAQF